MTQKLRQSVFKQLYGCLFHNLHYRKTVAFKNLTCRTPRWLLKTWLCFRAVRSAPLCGFKLEVLGHLIYKILWLLFCCLPSKNLNIQEGNMHDREDRITDSATGSFLGCHGHIHQFYWLLNFMYFYLKKFCYRNIKCLLSLV